MTHGATKLLPDYALSASLLFSKRTTPSTGPLCITFDPLPAGAQLNTLLKTCTDAIQLTKDEARELGRGPHQPRPLPRRVALRLPRRLQRPPLLLPHGRRARTRQKIRPTHRRASGELAIEDPQRLPHSLSS